MLCRPNCNNTSEISQNTLRKQVMFLSKTTYNYALETQHAIYLLSYNELSLNQRDVLLWFLIITTRYCKCKNLICSTTASFSSSMFCLNISTNMAVPRPPNNDFGTSIDIETECGLGVLVPLTPQEHTWFQRSGHVKFAVNVSTTQESTTAIERRVAQSIFFLTQRIHYIPV